MPHVRLVAAGRPSGGMRHVPDREGRQGGGRRRRRRPSHHAGSPVRALPDAAGVHVQRKARAAPLEARPEGPRQGRLGRDHLGRSARHHRRARELRQAELGRGVHRGVPRDGPRSHALQDAAGLCSTRHAELLLPHVGRQLLRPALLGGRLHPGRRLSRAGLRRLLPRPLRRPALRGAEVHRAVGQGPAVLQPRRLLRPHAHRPHEARLQVHRRRSPRHLDGRPCGLPPAAAPRHRRRAGPGHDQPRHPGRPVRPRLRGELVLRL